MIIESDNANELYQKLISQIDNYPDFIVRPRGMEVLEKLNVQAVLTNPRNCLITLKQRKLNYRFSAIEKLEYLWGKHDIERIAAYNPQMKKYANELGFADGNYAQRLNFWLDYIYHLLRKDPDSRQGVAVIYDIGARAGSADKPCTLTLQFAIRGGKLYLTTNMRSNDLLWGFPYDINAFCFLQEVMAKWLGVEMGTYTHNAFSMHIYMQPEENHAQLLATSVNNSISDEKNPIWNLTYEETKEWLPKFFWMEEQTRRVGQLVREYLPPCLSEYYHLLATKWTKNEIN